MIEFYSYLTSVHYIGCLGLTDNGLYMTQFGDACRTKTTKPACKYTGKILMPLFHLQHPIFFCIIVYDQSFQIHYLISNISACMTTEGKQCLFPFKYRNRTDDGTETELTFYKCSTEDLYRPWCPTSKN